MSLDPKPGDRLAVQFPNGHLYHVRVKELHTGLLHPVVIVNQERGGRVEDFPHRLTLWNDTWRTSGYPGGTLVVRDGRPGRQLPLG